MNPSSDPYENAFKLLRSGDANAAMKGLALLDKEVNDRPRDMKALFEYAGAFDFLGRENDALPLYEKVLAAGIEKLPEEDRPCLYVQLGSTLRNLKQFKRSKEVLEEGVRIFDGNLALKAFLALTEYSSGEEEKAIRILFEVILKHPADESISRYSRALRWYSENLK